MFVRALPLPAAAHGMDLLDKALRNSPDPGQTQQIVFGYSQGARVVADWLEEYGGAEGRTRSPDDLSFVLIGNPGRKHGGAHVSWDQAMPDTPVQECSTSPASTTWPSDFPDDPFNLLALANAYAGLRVHLHRTTKTSTSTIRRITCGRRTTQPTSSCRPRTATAEPLRWIGLPISPTRSTARLKETSRRPTTGPTCPPSPGSRRPSRTRPRAGARGSGPAPRPRLRRRNAPTHGAELRLDRRGGRPGTTPKISRTTLSTKARIRLREAPAYGRRTRRPGVRRGSDEGAAEPVEEATEQRPSVRRAEDFRHG